jgi:hypothetical protein
MSESKTRSFTKKPAGNLWFLPREHGATAMLVIPIVCVAILVREWRWSELATATAAFAALAAKDPMVVLARQRFVWKQPHPETATAAKWLAGWFAILGFSGLVLFFTWPLRELLIMGLGVGIFSALAIAVNVLNRQRSTLFQIASAFALTSSSLATCLSATGTITSRCLWLWFLLAIQSAAGILVVHSRLDARIAARGTMAARKQFRRAAQVSLGVLLCVAGIATLLRRGWIALALLLAFAGYWYDLRRQRDIAALQTPLKTVGQRALALLSLYSGLLILGFL